MASCHSKTICTNTCWSCLTMGTRLHCANCFSTPAASATSGSACPREQRPTSAGLTVFLGVTFLSCGRGYDLLADATAELFVAQPAHAALVISSFLKRVFPVSKEHKFARDWPRGWPRHAGSAWSFPDYCGRGRLVDREQRPRGAGSGWQRHGAGGVE